MSLRLRWRGWLILVAALLLFSACATASATDTIPGSKATTGLPIAITTNLASYSTGDPIGVTVINGATGDFYTQDGKSACTIVVLEKYDASKRTWTAVDGCNGAQTPRVLLIGRQTSTPYTLAPSSPSDINAWQPGTYRIALSYSAAADGVAKAQAAHSAAFTIHS